MSSLKQTNHGMILLSNCPGFEAEVDANDALIKLVRLGCISVFEKKSMDFFHKCTKKLDRI